MSVHIDVSELHRLAGMLTTTAAAAPAKATVAVQRTVDQVHAAAISGAPVATGELQASIQKEGAGLEGRVWSDTRQAYFLEVGSPNTGPPRAWLTGPAEDGSHELLVSMRIVGRIG